MPAPPPSSGSEVPGGPAGRIGSWLERGGTAICFLWGVAEATLFFIVPDVAVGAVALFAPRRWWRAAGAAIAGALVGGLALYLAARGAGPEIRGVIEAVPAIGPEMMERVRRDLAAHGGAALVVAPFAGIPYKIYAAEAALRGWDLAPLLLWTVPARAVRILPAAAGAALAGRLLRRPVRSVPAAALAVYRSAWAGLYAAYFRANGF